MFYFMGPENRTRNLNNYRNYDKLRRKHQPESEETAARTLIWIVCGVVWIRDIDHDKKKDKGLEAFEMWTWRSQENNQENQKHINYYLTMKKSFVPSVTVDPLLSV